MKIWPSHSLLYGLVVAAISCCAQASSAADLSTPSHVAPCQKDKEFAMLAAEADPILVASPNPQIDALERAMRDDGPAYFDIPLLNISVLKGEIAPGPFVMKIIAQPQPYAPAPDLFKERAGKETLLFLVRVEGKPDAYYLSNSRHVAQVGGSAQIAVTKAELDRQAKLLDRFVSDPSLPHYDRIASMLSALPTATQAQQEKIFQDLERLGLAGVPAMIAQMDDRRPLAYPHISLRNDSPNAFEAYRRYGPKQIVDALDAILNQITGYGGSIVHGGSERERQGAIAAWRVFAADMKCR